MLSGFVLGLAVQLCLTSTAAANVVAPRDPTFQASAAFDVAFSNEIAKRATAQAPNGYAPAAVDCPSTRPSIRSASRLSDSERSWLEKRRNNTVQPLRDFLTRIAIPDFDAGSYVDANRNNASALPNIAVAVSGGGYRALMNGAGALAAFDSRTNNSTSSGHLGGLLQATTYLAGLSGGGWLVGSIMVNNYTSVQAIQDTTLQQSGSLWQFENSIFEGPERGAIQLLSTVQYYNNIIDTVTSKGDAGYDTSITDIWSRALSFQLVNASQGGPAFTWSSIADDTDFSNANAPMPILVADGRAPGDSVISTNATVYEFNPWEMGSWDPTVYGFAPLKYTGSNFSAGELPQSEKCIAGFDNAAFVMGTSSSLFNQFLLGINNYDIPSTLKNFLTGVLEDLGNSNNDIADWTPNPFFHWNNATNPTAQSKRLTLVDGGEDLQNIPLHPLIQPNRAVDVIFAVDSSADTLEPGANWPNGTALVATYERSLNATMENGTAFPAIPDQNTFVNLGLNTRPTFFGCNASNFTDDVPPLVVYIPNHPYVFNSNVSTFDPSYNVSERNAIIENGYMVATMGNATVESTWPQCVGCAIMSRVWHRSGATVPDACTKCFQTHCWDGTRNSTTPAAFEPDSIFAEIKVNSGSTLTPRTASVAAMLIVLGLLLG